MLYVPENDSSGDLPISCTNISQTAEQLLLVVVVVVVVVVAVSYIVWLA
jgi:hypothetical protein